MAKHNVVKKFESGEISAEAALKLLGAELNRAMSAGKSIKALQAAVTQVVGISEEPEAEDYAGATAWESNRSAE
jgi:exonuclease VII small subunit